MINIQDIPSQPQRQDAVADQLADLVAVANRLGMYDAADAVQQMTKNLPKLKYGCHCDLEPDGMGPDECVLDSHDPLVSSEDCIYAKSGMRKEQCAYWKIIV